MDRPNRRNGVVLNHIKSYQEIVDLFDNKIVFSRLVVAIDQSESTFN